MPADFSLNNSVSASDARWLVGKLKELDKELFNQMRRDFRSEIRPFSRKLAANIPSAPPLSGLSPAAPFARQGVADRAPWVWKKPTASIDVSTRTRARRGAKSSEPVVRIRFNDRRPYSAFSVLERRSGGRLADLVNARYSFGDRGRWVVPQFYKDQGEMVSVAKKVLDNYAKRFSLTVARRMR